MDIVLRYENQTVNLSGMQLDLTNCHLIGNDNVVSGIGNIVDGNRNIFFSKQKKMNGTENVVHEGISINNSDKKRKTEPPEKPKKKPKLQLPASKMKTKLKEELLSTTDFGPAGFKLIPRKKDEPLDKNKSYEEVIACKLCYGNTVKVVIDSCNHLCLCIGCSRKLGKTKLDPSCPVCRKKITGFREVFLV